VFFINCFIQFYLFIYLFLFIILLEKSFKYLALG